MQLRMQELCRHLKLALRRTRALLRRHFTRRDLIQDLNPARRHLLAATVGCKRVEPLASSLRVRSVAIDAVGSNKRLDCLRKRRRSRAGAISAACNAYRKKAK